jgi:hypothetical protein
MTSTDRAAVPLAAWVEYAGGYKATGGYLLRKLGVHWVATKDGKEVMRDAFLMNVMMELCG